MSSWGMKRKGIEDECVSESDIWRRSKIGKLFGIAVDKYFKLEEKIKEEGWKVSIPMEIRHFPDSRYLSRLFTGSCRYRIWICGT